jgi:hypothetical protein
MGSAINHDRPTLPIAAARCQVIRSVRSMFGMFTPRTPVLDTRRGRAYHPRYDVEREGTIQEHRDDRPDPPTRSYDNRRFPRVWLARNTAGQTRTDTTTQAHGSAFQFARRKPRRAGSPNRGPGGGIDAKADAADDARTEEDPTGSRKDVPAFDASPPHRRHRQCCAPCGSSGRHGESDRIRTRRVAMSHREWKLVQVVVYPSGAGEHVRMGRNGTARTRRRVRGSPRGARGRLARRLRGSLWMRSPRVHALARPNRQ